MDKWSDQEIIRQMQALAAAAPANPRQTNFESAMAEGRKACGSSKPEINIPGKLMTVFMPIIEDMDAAVITKDLSKVVGMLHGIALTMAAMQVALMYRVPENILPVLQELVEKHIDILIERTTEK